MPENWAIDRELKRWILAVTVLGSGAFAVSFVAPKVESLFAAGATAPLLIHAIVISVHAIWILPVAALAGYLLRRRQVGTARVHAVGATGLLACGGLWLLIAIGGLAWPVLGL